MAIVVSLLESTVPELQAAMDRNLPMADLIEFRLDRVGNPGEEVLRKLIKSCSKPVIVTVHGKEGFGDYEGSLEERFELLHTAARAGAAFVDIDWRWSLDLGEMEGSCHRIVSRHEHSGTPEDLASLHEEQVAVLYEGDVVKLVTHAETTEDGLRVLRYLREKGTGLIAFCSGAVGSFTRLLAPIFGSPFTYAGPKSGTGAATAPGQWAVNELLGAMPPGGLGPQTAIFGVVGNPIGHSWSPLMHNMAMKAAHLDAIYVAFEPADMDRFLELANDENYRGFSVTAPFKEAALRLAKSAERAAEAAGAANTLVRDIDGGWLASNSDVSALREVLEASLHIHSQRGMHTPAVANAHVLVLGAGGAARAAAQATREIGAHLLVSSRRDDQAAALAKEFLGEHVAWENRAEATYQILLNCTPAGGLSQPDVLPMPVEDLPEGRIVIDANYRPLRTPLLIAAQERGNTPVPGGEWFVRQAAEQYQRFTHQEPDQALMRATFEHAYDGERRANRG